MALLAPEITGRCVGDVGNLEPSRLAASPQQEAPLEDGEPLLTRGQAYKLLVQRGYPIGGSTFDKLCSPAVGKGPPVVGWWPGKGGLRPLYRPRAVLAWAQAFLKSAPSPGRRIRH